MKKMIFWDFHGTLSYPDSLWSLNVYKTAMEQIPCCGLTREKVSELLDNDGFPWHHPEGDYTGLTDPGEWWQYVERLFYNTYIRCGLSKEQAKMLAPLVKKKILDSKNFRLYEDVKPGLQALSKMGYRHAVLSNNFPELEDILRALGIAGYFDFFIISALNGYEKPRRELFDAARRITGYPDVAIMVGDNPISDIAGAKEAGFQTVLLRKEAECCADVICDDIGELVAYLRKREAIHETDEMIIRRAREEESDVLTTLSFTSKHIWGYPEEYFDVWKNELTITESYIKNNQIYLADYKGQVIGYFSVTQVPNDFYAGEVFVKKGFWLEHLFIKPEFIKKGVGTRLINFAVDLCRKNGVRTLNIFADSNAAGFYNKIGAVYIDESPSSIMSRNVIIYQLNI